MTTWATEKLIDCYVAALGLDPNTTVHSLRVTAVTTASEYVSGQQRALFTPIRIRLLGCN